MNEFIQYANCRLYPIKPNKHHILLRYTLSDIKNMIQFNEQ